MTKEPKGTHGGARTPSPGKKIGRPPTGRKPYCFYLNDTEHEAIKALLATLRQRKDTGQ